MRRNFVFIYTQILRPLTKLLFQRRLFTIKTLSTLKYNFLNCFKNVIILPKMATRCICIHTRCNRLYLLQILLLAQHVSGTIMPIIRRSRVLYRWLLPVVFGALVFKLSIWCGAEGYVSGLRAATCKPDT
jgi:hypothetical protein